MDKIDLKDLLAMSEPIVNKASWLDITPPSGFIETMEQVNKDMVSNVHSQLEKQIKGALKAKGFEFKNDEEFYQFAKERCTKFSLPDDVCVLVVDADKGSEKIEVCQWSENVELIQKGNTFTVIYNQTQKTL